MLSDSSAPGATGFASLLTHFQSSKNITNFLRNNFIHPKFPAGGPESAEDLKTVAAADHPGLPVLQTINFFVRREDFLGQKFLGHKKPRKDTKRMFLIVVDFLCLFATFCGSLLIEFWFRLRRARLIRVHLWFLNQEKFCRTRHGFAQTHRFVQQHRSLSMRITTSIRADMLPARPASHLRCCHRRRLRRETSTHLDHTCLN